MKELAERREKDKFINNEALSYLVFQNRQEVLNMPRIRELLDTIEEYKICLVNKNAESILPHFVKGIDLYQQWREHNILLQNFRETLNKLNRQYKKTKDKSLIEESRAVKTEIQTLSEKVRILSDEISKIEIMLPNWTSEDVPLGSGDEYEKSLQYIGTPKVWDQYKDDFGKMYPDTPFETIEYRPLHHYDLVGTYIDQEIAGNVALSRFYYEFDELVILDFAITMYALEFFRKKGYGDRLMITPYMMRKSVEERITYFEAFEDTIFEIEKDKLLLIPSSEHSIIAFYADTIFNEEDLPIRITAWSPSFRREAGSHGIDTRGIFRVKQFHKVEIHSILRKDEDFAELERIRINVQEFLMSLGLPNRSVIVPTGDMDKRVLKQIDIETWMPGQGRYRETHSIATLGTWVSEKLKLRYRTGKGKELTRNVYATGVAVQRVICALVENLYDPDEEIIRIPSTLEKYMMGIEEIHLER